MHSFQTNISSASSNLSKPLKHQSLKPCRSCKLHRETKTIPAVIKFCCHNRARQFRMQKQFAWKKEKQFLIHKQRPMNKRRNNSHGKKKTREPANSNKKNKPISIPEGSYKLQHDLWGMHTLIRDINTKPLYCIRPWLLCTWLLSMAYIIFLLPRSKSALQQDLSRLVLVSARNYVVCEAVEAWKTHCVHVVRAVTGNIPMNFFPGMESQTGFLRLLFLWCAHLILLLKLFCSSLQHCHTNLRDTSPWT